MEETNDQVVVEEQDKIVVEDISSVEKRVSFNISTETVQKKTEEFFQSIRKKAELPGFRKGKVPLPVLKQHFKSYSFGVVSQSLVSEFFPKLLKDYNISPVGPPKFDKSQSDKYVGKFNDDNSFSVSMSLEVLPKLNPIGYNGMVLEFAEVDTKKFCGSQMDSLQNQFAVREQIKDQPAMFGDSVVIDFKGFIGGEAFNGGEANGFTIEALGNNTLVEGFEKQIIGMSPGEKKRIKVVFPEKYDAAHLAGKEAEFDVELFNIVRKKKSEVNNDLALMAGFSSVEDLNKDVQEKADKWQKNEVRRQAERIIAETLVKANDFDIPESLLKLEEDRLTKHFGERQVRFGGNEIKSMAVKNVKRSILLDAIYEKEAETHVTPDELDKFLQEQAVSYGKTKDELVSILYNSGQMDIFMGTLKEAKVVDFIVNNRKQESEVQNG